MNQVRDAIVGVVDTMSLADAVSRGKMQSKAQRRCAGGAQPNITRRSLAAPSPAQAERRPTRSGRLTQLERNIALYARLGKELS